MRAIMYPGARALRHVLFISFPAPASSSPLYLAYLFTLGHARRWFNSQTGPGNCERPSNYIRVAEITEELLYDFDFTRYFALYHVVIYCETFSEALVVTNVS